MTLFERCVGAAHKAYALLGPNEFFDEAITRAVLATLRDGTGSLRTAEEIDRVLAEAEG